MPADKLIEASDEDAAAFSVNAVNIDKQIVMARPPQRLKDLLTERGYTVTGVDLAPFIMSGGGAYCMTLRLDRGRDRCAGRWRAKPRPLHPDSSFKEARMDYSVPRTSKPSTTAQFIALENRYGASNYKPLDVVLTRGEGVMSGTWRASAISIACRPIRPSIRAIAIRRSWRR